MNQNRTIDLKKYGISQDINELKDNKKGSSYYNPNLSKAKLELMKTSHNVKYESKAPSEQKEIAKRLIQEAKGKISSQENIGKQEKKIYEKSAIGRFEKYAKKKLGERVIARKIFKPNKMSVHIKERTPAPYEPIFFKNNFEKEKRSMFLE